MKVNIITLFPEIIQKHLEYLPFRRAIDLKVLEVNVVNLRNFALDSYGTVDGKPYGGGKGMLLRVEPIYAALQSLNLPKNNKTILLSPKGQKYTQEKAKNLSNEKEITLISGRYEGVDARVDKYISDKISIGDFVLSGGELPALIVAESLTRLLPGVLDSEATTLESHSTKHILEHPQYTRPEEFDDQKVPEVLLSGNHAEIEKWKRENSKRV